MSSKKITPDPRLQIIREEGLKAPPVEYDVKELIEKTRRVHAGWLFDFDYKLLLQKLCRLLDGNYDTCNTPGWGSFGYSLGLNKEILNVIQYSKLGDEGYTYYVLLHYVQKSDATIHKIIDTLLTIKRLDVINETHLYFNKLSERILGTETDRRECVNSIEENNQDSGFCSVTSDCSNQGGDQEIQAHDHVDSSILRPNFIPKPQVLLEVLSEKHDSTILPSSRTFKVEHNQLQNTDIPRTPVNIPVLQQPRQVVQNYDCKVMLTFANDGIEYANEVASTLRKNTDGLQIGVLILNEHRNTVESNPELFINGAIPQVDFVVPIITEEYLSGIMNIKVPQNCEILYIDCKYIRFIYTLMMKHYVRNGCLNKKVRCIIPDDMIYLTRKSLMRDPLFDTWVKSSSTHKLARRMLARCERKKFNK